MKKGLTRLLLLWSCVCLLTTVQAADFYWVNNGGNWNDGSHWSKGSGDLINLHNAVPTQNDNVIFDNNSFTTSGQVVLLGIGDNYCYNMSWTGVSNNPTLKFPSAASRLNIHYKIDLDNNMSVDFVGAEIFGVIHMLNTGVDASGFIAGVSTRGKALPNIYFEGVGGKWSLTETLNVAGQIKVTNGTFRSGAPSTSTFDVNTKDFIVDGAAVALELDRMNITATSLFRIANAASLIYLTKTMGNTYLSNISTPLFEVTSSTITDFGSLHITGTDGVLSAAGKNLQFFGAVTLEAITTSTILGSHTYEEDIIFNQPGSIIKLEAGSTQSFSNKTQILAPGTSCANFITLQSTIAGSAANIDHTSGGSASNVSFFYLQDIHVGSPSDFQAGQSVDLGNVVGWAITETGGNKLYWIGGSGDWSEGSHWSVTSGGLALGCIPTAADTVIFDGNSFPGSAQTVTLDLPAIYFNTMIWTDPDDDQPTWSIPGGSINIGGSLTLAPSMNVVLGSPASVFFNFVSDSPDNTITATDNNLDGFDLGNVTFDGSGSWSLGGEFNVSNHLNFNGGTFNTGAGNYNISADQITVDGGSVNLHLNDSKIFVNNFYLQSVGNFDAGQSNLYIEVLLEVTPANIYFNEVFMEGPQTVIRGTDLIFFDLQLTSTVQSTIFGSHTYSNLLQFNEPGMIVAFEAGTTQKVNNINSLGTLCGGEILIRSTLSGSPVTFEALPGVGDIALSFVLLQDNTADPAGQARDFVASSSQNLGNVTGWDFSLIDAVESRKFYWIGGTGNWNNPAKWSFESGGDPANCIPTPIDDVEFDANSFSVDGRIITLDGPEQYCRNMLWTDEVAHLPILRLPAGNELFIYGSLRLASTAMMSLNFGAGDAAMLWFKATSMGNNIVTSGHLLPNIILDGAGGGWDLSTTASLSVIRAITLINGHLNTAAATITAPQFLVTGPNAALTLGTSTLNIAKLFQITAISALNAGSSSLITNVLTANVGGLTFGQVQLMNSGIGTFNERDTTEINGNGLTFNTLILSGTGPNIIHGSHQFNEVLQFDYATPTPPSTAFPNTTFIFDAGSTQTLAPSCSLISNSTTSSFSTIATSESGQTATFSKTGGSVCLEFIRIFNIVATGGAVFAFNNLSAGVFENASGWIPTVGIACSVFLPVECIDFDATLTADQEVELYWSTAQEINNRGFEIQRSTDGRSFEAIGWINGAGTVTEAQKYRYVDRNIQGLSDMYYRLLQVDIDGTEAYACDVEAVRQRNGATGPMIIAPNPAGALLQVRWFGKKSGTAIIRLFDQSGRLVLDREWNTLEGSNQQELPIVDLARGIYELQLLNANGTVESARLVKQ